MTEGRFYRADPKDPDAPVLLDHYKDLRPGMAVVYANPKLPLTSFGEPITITELWSFKLTGRRGRSVTAILNDGEWEVTADNLKPAPAPNGEVEPRKQRVIPRQMLTD
jgi:hypothetical protein